MKFLIYYLFFLLLGLNFGCSYNPETPEGLIKMFVSDLSKKSLDRSYYEKYTTGKLLNDLNKLDDDELLKRSKAKKIESAKTKILATKCETISTCTVTYRVEFRYITDKNNKSAKGHYHNEVKKIAELKKVEGNWKIASVTNLKTYIEGTSPLGD